jgi:hypothetical protein
MTKECVHCGYCCSKAPCSYGKVIDGKCIFLVVEDKEIGTFLCCAKSGIEERESGNKYPMFGSGCSSSMFNSVREEVLRKIHERSREKSSK